MSLQRLGLQQTQSTVLSPALHQAIKLLQLSAQDLDLFIRDALESNPFLLQETESEPAPEGPGSRTRLKRRFGGALAPDPALARMLGERFGGTGGGRGAAPGAEGEAGGAAELAAATTLRDHVAREVGGMFRDPGDRALALALAEQADEAGYLSDPLERIAEQLDAPAEKLAAILETLQGIDPPGLFARDVPECLALQLRDRGRLDAPMRALLDNLEMLAAGDLDRLAPACGVDRETLDAMIAELRTLDPRPGLAFSEASPMTLVPDLVVTRGGGPGAPAWQVAVNPALVPRLFIDKSYYDEIRAAAKRDDKAYLSEQLRSAHWLLRALDQRSETVLAVADEIVRRQAGFLEQGVMALRPLVLREIAEALEMHESTVSRAVAGKYIETPRGTFELRYFFSAAIPDIAGGPPHSARAVKARLAEMVAAESRPLSDAALTRLLREEGYDIARRTVAKYREELGLPPSRARRRAGP